MLSFTPPERLTDARGRPYFLWDCDLTVEEFRARLEDPDPEVRAYLVGKLMRQAKPDDVFLYVRPREIRELWPRLLRYLGRTREFWTWLFDTWEAQGRVWR
jgi:hypothetical protein